MKTELIPGHELSDELIDRWDEIVRSEQELSSPYFRPEFTQAVAAIRRNVEVAVLRHGPAVVGFFPFERVGRYAARPVGGRLSDYQGIISPRDLPWRVPDLMDGCRLQAWEFDHHLATQQQLEQYATATGNSWRINVSTGFDAYIAGRKAAAARGLDDRLRKFRKLQREHRVRLEWHVTDEAVFDQLLAWKSAQYRRSEFIDLFSHAWIVNLVKNIWRTQTPEFAGVLSVLYANEKPAAIHFGMQSGPVLHSWFPAYDASMATLSPGSALFLLLIQHAPVHGVSLIDLGKGDDSYKLTLANETFPLVEGMIETRRFRSMFRGAWSRAREHIHGSSLRKYVRMPLRWLRQTREWLARCVKHKHTRQSIPANTSTTSL